jgi:hypothetical protein
MKFNPIPQLTAFSVFAIAALAIQNPVMALGNQKTSVESSINLNNGQSKIKPSSIDVKPVVPSLPLSIAQLDESSTPLYGSWRLTFSVGGIVYKGVLVMNGYSGVARISYFNYLSRKTEFVDQQIRLKSSSIGLVLLGYAPVYANTSIRHPTYSPDNFLISVMPNGSLKVTNCDDAQRCSDVDVEVIRQ